MSAIRLRRWWLVALVAGVVALGGCADRGGVVDVPPPPPVTDTPAPPGVERWLAVIEVAPLADDLSETTERVRDRLGLALIVSPIDCIEGLPSELRSGYVLGAVGDTAAEVERLIDDAGERALFTERVTVLCTD